MMTDEIRALARKVRWKHTEEWEEGKRLCRKCNKMKLFEEFHKHVKCKGGYNSVCIECRKPLSKATYKRTSVEYRLWYVEFEDFQTVYHCVFTQFRVFNLYAYQKPASNCLFSDTNVNIYSMNNYYLPKLFISRNQFEEYSQICTAIFNQIQTVWEEVQHGMDS